MQTEWNLQKNVCVWRSRFQSKNLYKWVKHGFAIKSLSWKESPWSGNTLSGKEKVLGATVSGESHVDNIQGNEKAHHYWFSLKKVQL